MSGDEQRNLASIVRFGVFEADLAAGELRREGMLVKLQEQPFRLLAILLKHPGAIVAREELRTALWPDGSFVDFEYGVNTAIKKLRYALGDSAENPRFIQTLPRKGYRFIAPINTEGSRQDNITAPSVAASPKRHTWIIAAVLAALAASGLWVLRHKPAPLPPGLPIPLAAYPGSEWSVAFSPDGHQFAFSWNGVGRDNDDIYLKRNDSDSLTRLTTDPASDFSPAWSPDGRRIAFLRILDKDRVAVMIVPAVGGPEVKIAETHIRLYGRYAYHRNLAFSPDGNWLITPDLDGGAPWREARPAGLLLISVENGSRRPLTLPPQGYDSDTSPALAPDGRSLAFVRGATPMAKDLYVLPLDRSLSASGEPRRLTSWNRYTISPAWTADGREIIVANGQYENTHLWRVPVSGNGDASLIASAGDGSMLPAFAPDGRLAFTRVLWNKTIYKLDLAAPRKEVSPLHQWSASSSRLDSNPRFSPNGRRVAFVSDRSGTYQIWVANADGSGAFQLTSVTAPFVGSPSWSPDGSTILFDGTKNGHFEVYAVSAAGGTPRRLMGSGTQDAVASFSRDRRWIYFTSNRTGEYQIWRIPAEGGEPVQWTRRGGRVARESTDGRQLFFAKTTPAGWLSVWRMSAAGGEETEILGPVWNYNFDLTNRGIYYPGRVGFDGADGVYFYSFTTGRSTQIADRALRGGQGLAVSADGTTLLVGQSTEIGADLMVLENFH